jgi:ATP-binding cassette, subfamily B, multidrug efflux pump
MKHLKYLNRFFLNYKWRFLLGILFVIISNVFGVLPPIVIRHAFDLVRENIILFQQFKGLDFQQDFYRVFASGLVVFGVVVLLLAVMKGLFMFFMRQTIIVMSRKIEYDLKNVIYDHYQKLDLGFYKRNQTGDMMSRVAEDVTRVRMYLGPAIMYAINTIVMAVMVISLMLSVNVELTLYVLLPLPVLSISIFYINNLINKKSEAIQKQLGFLTNIAQEVYNGIRVIKSYVQEKTYGKYFDKESENYRTKALELARIEALFFPLMLLLIGLSTIITIYVGGVQVMQGKITTGNIAEFVIYVNMLTWPVTAIGWVASIVQRAAASQKRINEMLFTRPAIEDEISAIPVNGIDSIAFNQVSFTYPDTGVIALKEVDFSIQKGEKVAIVGRTGSGKSTIVELMMRLYDVEQGEVLINGKTIKELKIASYRSDMGYVPQDVFLFSDTIFNNIAFGNDDATYEDVMKAASNASIKEEIEQLPEGFETMVGERGVTLSGGQKQRISIARVFCKSSEMLILDDCLSAVDAKTEKRILENLDTVIKDKTALIITHRIFTLLEFDKIIVIENGELAEIGTHNELISRKGIYYDLLEQQKSEESFTSS